MLFKQEVRHLIDNLLKELISGEPGTETQERVLNVMSEALDALAALHEDHVRRERAKRYVVTLEVGRLKETRTKETLNEVFGLMAAYDLHSQTAITEGLNEHGTVRLGGWTVEDKQWTH